MEGNKQTRNYVTTKTRRDTRGDVCTIAATLIENSPFSLQFAIRSEFSLYKISMYG
jgi:hypothetical protein